MEALEQIVGNKNREEEDLATYEVNIDECNELHWRKDGDYDIEDDMSDFEIKKIKDVNKGIKGSMFIVMTLFWSLRMERGSMKAYQNLMK